MKLSEASPGYLIQHAGGKCFSEYELWELVWIDKVYIIIYYLLAPLTII